MARRVLDDVLAFTKGHVCRLRENSGSSRSGPLAVRLGILHPDQDRVSYLPQAWRDAISPHVGDYHCTIAELKLRSMVVTDPDALGEPERVRQPNHCCSNIWIDQNRNHGCVRY